MQEQFREGQFREAVKNGEEWLRDNRKEKGEPEYNLVYRLVGVGYLSTARSMDTHDAYRRFRQVALPHPGWRDLSAEALTLESIAFFRDEVVPSKSSEACRAFRDQYPQSPKTSESKAYEAEFAFFESQASGEIQDIRSFWTTYESWPEAAKWVQKGKTLEPKLAFAKVKSDPSVPALRAYRWEYGEWEEAKEYLPQVKTMEVQRAYNSAIEQNDLTGWRHFIREYGAWDEAIGEVADMQVREFDELLKRARIEGTLQALELLRNYTPQESLKDRADAEIGDWVAGALNTYAGRAPDPGWSFWSLMDRYTERPIIMERIQSLDKKVWTRMKKEKNLRQVRLFLKLFPDSVRVKDAEKTLKKMLYTRAKESRNLVAIKEFFVTYPTDPRAAALEERYFHLKKVQGRYGKWPQASVSHRLRLNNGNERMIVDVRDCLNQRVSGLQKEDFEVYYDEKPGKVVDFKGLEDDRPLDVVFVIDLSRSMAVEQRAVREAVMDFAETLKFRGRDVRFGLVTFSNDVHSRHHPTGNLNKFAKWMSRIGHGDSNEDPFYAIFEAGKLKFRAKAERILIQITDEIGVLGENGSSALFGHKAELCVEAQWVTSCMANARNSRQRRYCKSRTTHAVSKLKKVQKQCERVDSYFGARGETVYDDDGGVATRRTNWPWEKIAKKSTQKKVRLFFMVPDVDKGYPLPQFEEWARLTQGKTVMVPKDSPEVGPYRQALLEIAEDLSKQYILVVRPPPGTKRELTGIPLVDQPHLWNQLSAMKTDELLGLFPMGGTSDCPELAMVTRTQGIFRSENCGETWTEAEWPGTAKNLVNVSLSSEHGVLVMAADDSMYLLEKEGRMLQRLALDGAWSAKRQMVGLEGEFWIAAQDVESRWSIFRYDGAFHPVVEEVMGVGTSAVPLLLTGKKGEVCMLKSAKALECFNADGRPTDSGKVKGLGKKAMTAGAQLMRLPQESDVFVLSQEDGRVMRTVDGGGLWKEVLPKRKGGQRNLVELPGEEAGLCAISSESVLCSTDRGRTYQEMGRPFDEEGVGVMTAVENDLFLAQGGKLSRLQRIVNRDMPSTSLYFDTASDEPTDSMKGFLDELGETLLADESYFLRVEGHADSRGSTEDNMQLSKRRADAVTDYIAGLGVDPARLQGLSYGESKPIRKGLSGKAFAKNRRVELILLQAIPQAGWDSDPCAGIVVEEEYEEEEGCSDGEGEEYILYADFDLNGEDGWTHISGECGGQANEKEEHVTYWRMVSDKNRMRYPIPELPAEHTLETRIRPFETSQVRFRAQPTGREGSECAGINVTFLKDGRGVVEAGSCDGTSPSAQVFPFKLGEWTTVQIKQEADQYAVYINSDLITSGTLSDVAPEPGGIMEILASGTCGKDALHVDNVTMLPHVY